MNATHEEVFDLAQKINDFDGFLEVSVLAISNRLCEVEVKARKKAKHYEKNEAIIRDNLSYKEALMLFKGIYYGRYLPT
jgi:hypothetical protein